jgi:hypothetical protein
MAALRVKEDGVGIVGRPNGLRGGGVSGEWLGGVEPIGGGSLKAALRVEQDSAGKFGSLLASKSNHLG